MNWVFLAANVGFAIYWLHEWDRDHKSHQMGLCVASVILAIGDACLIAKEIL
jgi:hypothetical protein